MSDSINGVNEKDWKLFRKKLPDWQENFMDRLNREYAAILAQKGKNPSDIFWELEDRLKRDKRLTGVMICDNSRSKMYMHMCELLKEGAITLDDLSDFSVDLQEQFQWLVKPENRWKEHHMANTIRLYHGSHEIVDFPEIRKSTYTKDFSWGFYCTNNLDQAIRWAKRGNGCAIVNEYTYVPDDALSVLKFDTMSDEWLDFIAHCRSGGTHQYDVVEGPMANDTIWNYVNDFIRGTITRKQFWALAEFRYPTHQISFHTLSALNCLSFEGSRDYDQN